MSSIGVEHNALVSGAKDWESLATLMDNTSQELTDQSTSPIPESARSAASTFLTRWAGYAGESSEIATGFSGALDASVDNYFTADDAADRKFADLDGRLGPQT